MMNLDSNDPYEPTGFAFPDGFVAGCEARPPESPPGSIVPMASLTDVPLVDEADWVEQESIRSLETWKRDIDQGRTTACTLASKSNAAQFVMARDGRPHRDIDWHTMWMDITGGRGGANLAVACRYAMDQGMPYLNAKGEPAGRIKIAEAWDCDSLAGLASALQRGCICTFGHDGHAECATRMFRKNGVWYLDVRNSWGRDWGDNGWHLFPLKDVEIRTYGAILIREVEYIA
jgi:hypothetical protein